MANFGNIGSDIALTGGQSVRRDSTDSYFEAFTPSAGAGVPDASYGDITVSNSGGTWTVNTAVISLDKMADMADASVIYRQTSGVGMPEVQTIATLKTDMGLGNVDDTSDANKPVSSATQTALNLKADLISPSFTTPTLGTATATTINKVTITAPASSAAITIANGKTLTASNSITLAGTDSTTMTFPTTSSTLYKTLFARVSGADATTTGQSLANITGLSIALEASSVYELRVGLLCGTSAVTTGTKYGINFSAAGAAVFAGYNGTTTDTSNVTNRMTALNTGTSTYMTTSASTNGSFALQGIVTTGANAGNLTVQHLKVTSGTSTVFIGSYMTVTKIA